MGDYPAICSLNDDQIGASAIVKIVDVKAEKRVSFSEPIEVWYKVEHLDIEQLWAGNITYIPSVGGWMPQHGFEMCLGAQATSQLILQNMLRVSTSKWRVCFFFPNSLTYRRLCFLPHSISVNLIWLSV